jgi:hypothetical protein
MKFCWAFLFSVFVQTAIPAELLQNDNYAGGAANSIALPESDAIAAKFTASPSTYPLVLEGLQVLTMGGIARTQTVNLEVYADNSATPTPGPLIFSHPAARYLITGAGFNDLDVRSFGIVVCAGSFRVVLVGGAAGVNGPSCAFDGTITAARNTYRAAQTGWQFFEQRGGSGDFIIRARVRRLVPPLHILRDGGNVALRWPYSPFRFTLQQNFTAGPLTAWSDITQEPILIGTNNQVTLPNAGGTRFFRLKLSQCPP